MELKPCGSGFFISELYSCDLGSPEQLFVAQELINKVKSKCCGIKAVIKSEYVKTNVAYTDDDEVRTLNFFFSDGSAFAIAVHWDYSGSNMKYTY